MKKILIFSNGEKIGDGIIKLPFIQEVFSQFNNAEITWLAYGTTVYSSILREISSKYLSEVIYNSKLNILPWKEISTTYSFQYKYYDIIIDTQKTVYKTISLKRIKSKIFISATASWFFSDIKPSSNYKENKYYLDNLFYMLSLILKKKITRINKYYFSEKLQNNLKKIFYKKNLCIGIAPGAGEKNKKWKIENFIEVAKFFIKKNYDIAFFVGPDDFYEKKIILKFFPNAFFPESLIKNFSGPEIIMASTKFLVCSLSNDSGVSHMLSTNLCPLVKLFGPRDPEKFTPKSSKIKIISSREYDSKNINIIPVEQVIKTINELI